MEVPEKDRMTVFKSRAELGKSYDYHMTIICLVLLSFPLVRTPPKELELQPFVPPRDQHAPQNGVPSKVPKQ